MKAKTYTVQCWFSYCGWKVLSWRPAHQKSRWAHQELMPQSLADYLLVGEQQLGAHPILCSEGVDSKDVARDFGRDWLSLLELDEYLIRKTYKNPLNVYLTLRMSEELLSKHAPDDPLLEQLDAYDHLSYVVGYSDEDNEDVSEDSDRGDWLACFDFLVDRNPDGTIKVAHHVVVNTDSGGFIDTVDRGVVTLSEDMKKAPFDLPDYWASIGMDHGTCWTEKEVKDSWECNKRWNRDLKEAIANIERGE